MSIRQRLRAILVCATLEFAALTGMVMPPEQIVELMQTMNQPKVARVLPDESNDGDGE